MLSSSSTAVLTPVEDPIVITSEPVDIDNQVISKLTNVDVCV